MGAVSFIDRDEAIKASKDQQTLRGRQLLVAALAYYHGEMGEQEFVGFVCRYGAAASEAAAIRQHGYEIAAMKAGH
jgi:hypothetical protein